MIGIRQYKRSCAVKFGDASSVPLDGENIRFNIKNLDDDGIRMKFHFFRSNRGTPDKGKLELWNLNKRTQGEISDDLQSMITLRRGIEQNLIAFADDAARAAALKVTADNYGVTVYGGYDGKPEVIFRGDMLDVEHKRKGQNVVTEIQLGDSLLALRDGYINRTFGTGATMDTLLSAAVQASGLEVDDASKVIISSVAPNATITATSEGMYAVGRPADTIDEVADLFGLQWWVRDGKVIFVPQGSVTSDFTVLLQEGRGLLDLVSPSGFGDVKGISLLSGKLHPGRGLIIRDLDGKPISATGHRINTTELIGDTHGNPWNVKFTATEVAQSILAPNLEFTDAQFDAL